MYRYIIIFALLTAVSLSLEPVAKVPAKIEIKGGPLFWSEYARVITTAEALKHQLEMLDETPAVDVPALPETIAGVAQLQYTQYEVLWENAKTLEEQVRNLADDMLLEKYLQQKESIKKLDKELFLAQSQQFMLERDSERYTLLKSQEDDLKQEIESLQNKLDSLNHSYFKRFVEARNKLNDMNNDMLKYTNQVISIAGSANFVNYRNEMLETDVSPGVMMIFNPSSILGFGSVFDVYAQYIAPVAKSAIDGTEFKTDFYNFGLHLNIPISYLLNINDFQTSLKLGGGFFWASTRTWNAGLTDRDWNGQTLRLELNFSNNSIQFPLEVYTAYSFYNVNNNLRYAAPNHTIDLGKNLWFNNFEIGLRFALWRTAFKIP